MDKLMNNHWVMKIIALLLACMLYMSVNLEAPEKETSTSPFPGVNNHVETVTDVPVVGYYDRENYVVSGLPQHVNVTLEGPTSIVKKTAYQQDFEVYADLKNLSIGTHQVQLKYRNIDEKIKIRINPAIVTVVIQEKVTREFPVEVEFYNEGKLKKGYKAEEPLVKPKYVNITGPKELIESIDRVSAKVDLQGADETIETESRVTVYDVEDNVLSVEVEPSIVEVTVPITSPSKSVPFKINRKGSLQKGLSIVKMESEPNEVTVYGPQDVIDKIDFIDGVTVNLDEIKEDTSIDVEIPVPKGVKKVVPEKVTIRIDVEEEVTKTFEDVPIKSFGLASQYILSFLDPEKGTIDLAVMGAPSVINNMKSSDIELYVNASDLGEGEHELKIDVNGPPNISWSLSKDKAKIKITRKS
jgi:YbbR domain-containing protein